MTPPVNFMGRSSTGNGNGIRRAEFSGLSTIDSGAPEESPPPHWDTETGTHYWATCADCSSFLLAFQPIRIESAPVDSSLFFRVAKNFTYF